MLQFPSERAAERYQLASPGASRKFAPDHSLRPAPLPGRRHRPAYWLAQRMRCIHCTSSISKA